MDEERVEELTVEMEQGFYFLGCTAIEDKLQNKVPDTIANLRDGGIIVWVLTGDKIETAISIGFSCQLLTPAMDRIQVDSEVTEEIERQLDAAIVEVSTINESGVVYALVVSGMSLLKIMAPGKEAIAEKFLKIADNCAAVLACRVSPKQKADIVRFIRAKKPDARTLAIGDGANDVNMITAAHVGVGISGLEGQQAVRASDYAIAQFSFLQRLLFVYGRESYRRNANLVCYNFYKNVLLVMPLFFYGTVSVFSGVILYNNWTYQFFNILFTSFPIMVYSLFDKERSFQELHDNPIHYQPGLHSQHFNVKIFWYWIIEAMLQSVAILFISLFAVCAITTDGEEGRMDNMYVGGVLVLALVVLVANIKVVTFTFSHYWFSVLISFLSIVVLFLFSAILTEWLPISEFLENYDSRGSTVKMLANPMAWFAIFAVLYLCFMLTPISTVLKETIFAVKHWRLSRAKSIRKRLATVDMSQSKWQKDKFVRPYTGFAYSGAPGQTPQITDPNWMVNKVMAHALATSRTTKSDP